MDRRKMYYTYMLRCEDNSIYTGITTDIERRVGEHISGTKKAAKYTSTHAVSKVEIAWKSENRSLASKLEYWIKTLTKQQKEELIQKKCLDDFLSDKLDTTLYIIIE